MATAKKPTKKKQPTKKQPAKQTVEQFTKALYQTALENRCHRDLARLLEIHAAKQAK
jgi:hypothetical protein